MGDVSKAAEALKQLDIEDKFTKLKNAFPDTADDAIRTALGMSDIGDAASKTTDKLDDFIKASDGAASSVLSFAKSHAMLLGGTAIVAVIAWAISAYNKYKQTMIETASEATSTWNASKTSLREYATQYEELKIKLDSGDLSEEETLSVKKEILDIQQKITSEYGNSVSGIDLVNGGLETQLSLLKQISQEEAQTNINENRQAYEDAEKEMQKERAYELGVLGTRQKDGTYVDEVSNDIEEIVKEYDDLFTYVGEKDGVVNIRFTGNAEQAKEVINDFESDIENLKSKYGEDNNLINSILSTSSQSLLQNKQNVLDNYYDNYMAYLEQQMYASGNSDVLLNYGQAISDYNEALLSGDTSLIYEAEIAFKKATEAKNTFISSHGDEFNSLFEPLYENLDTATIKYNDFKEALEDKADSNNQFKDQQKEIKQCADEVESYEMYATEALEALINGGHDASDSLWTLAQAWGGLDENSSTEEMNAFLDVLAQAGIISQDTTEQLVNLDNAIEKVNSRISVLNQLGTEGISSDKLLDAISQADETENAGDDYLKADSYLDEAKKMYDKGLIGTDDFKARAAYFSPTMATDPANFIENYEKADRYLSENATGLLNFLNDLEEKNLASSDVLADGTKVWTYNIKDFDEAAQKMGISTEFLLDIFGRLEDYGFSNNFASSVEEANEKIVDKAAELANAKAKLAEMETTGQYTTLDENGNEVKTMANSTALAEQRALVQGLEQDLLQLQQTREYLASQEADNYANQVKQAKEAYATILEERNRILEENTYGEDTATVAALMEEQLRKIAEENYLSIDGELNLVNEEELEDHTVEVEVNTEGDADLTRLDEALNILTLRASDGITIKLNNTDEIDYAVNKIEQFPTDVPVNISFNVANQEQAESLSSTLDELNAKRTEDAQISYSISIANSGEAISNVDDIDNKEIDNKNYDVSFNYQENISRLNTINQKSIANKEYTVTQRQKTIVESPLKVKTSKASGTLSPALASGTAYNMLNLQPAYAGGRDVAIDKDQVALVNELPGHEGIIRNGQLYKIPGGMHYQNLKQGDIVLSASQMEQLERTGRASGKGQPIGWARSFAQGTLIQPAYASGSGGGSFGAGGSGSKSGVTKYGTEANTKATNKNTAATQANTDAQEEVFDWIEIAIQRITEAIDRAKLVADSMYKTLTTRNNAIAEEISLIHQQISVQNQAYNRYLKEADSVGLAEPYAEKVRNGTIDIETITDENLTAQINKYQEFYDKAVAAKDAVAELHEEIASLYTARFDNIATDFDNQLAQLEHLTNTYNNQLDALEAKGYLESKKLYQSLQAVEQSNIATLKDELSSLQSSFNEAMNSGEIVAYSESWYDMQSSINGVKEAIQEANISLAEYEKTMRELDWSYFDYLNERIAEITAESEFLISLMENSDLYDDKGAFTDEGKATVGLRGQNYNVLMAQADKYAEEIKSITKELANDPYNTDIIERREELLELQRDSILAAEDEKQAIKDLISEGYDAQLESLQELMDTYKESLNNAKDLYDYQKNIEDQTKNISSLRKQLEAYSGDDSEENRARIQQLEVNLSDALEELEETEYDRFISDQEKLLDDIYDEYEKILNERLDDVDALLSEMIDTINTDFTSIAETISTEAGNVGYELTDNMKSIWEGTGNVITQYGDNFTNQLTSVNTTLNSISTQLKSMIDASDSSTDTPSVTTQTSVPVTTTPVTTTQTTATTSEVTVGGRVNASGALIYEHYTDTSGSKQYFSNDPVYIVLQEKNGYVQVRHHSAKSGVTGWFKKSDVKAYASGLRKAYKDEDAWVNEDGQEFILKPSENAVMTQISKGDTVLTKEMTDNIWSMASDPSKFINDNLYNLPSFQNVKGANINTGNNTVYTDFNITLPGVTNYKDFRNELLKDKTFEKAIQSVTTDAMFGGSTLSKRKYIK